MLLSTESQPELYRRMLRIRHFELAAEVQLREGNVPSVCHSSIEQKLPLSVPAWLCATMIQ